MKNGLVVRKTDYSLTGIIDLVKSAQKIPEEKQLLLDYPTVYLVYSKNKDGAYNVYVGETNDIKQRTGQHLSTDAVTRSDWKHFLKADTSQMIVIGHSHFNKSLTMDIENKMMLYMSGLDGVKQLTNRRENEQNMYYTEDERDEIFSAIWKRLRGLNDSLFPVEKVIRDNALFKASPFHKLTQEQYDARAEILQKVIQNLRGKTEHQLILVEGDAGTGKTVLLSSLFYLLRHLDGTEEFPDLRENAAYLLVNHDQQLKVYQEIAEKLGITNKDDSPVNKPTSFINHHSPDDPVDLVLVDEAHLLWTQGKQAYRGKNQLDDIVNRAKVTIAVFDPHQVLKTEEYLESQQIKNLEQKTAAKDNLVILKTQLRLKASKETVAWIKAITDKQEVLPYVRDKHYDLRVFDDPQEMFRTIKKLDADNVNGGLARMLATFDWPYKQKGKPDNGSNYWLVTAGEFSQPWNLQLPLDPSQRGRRKKLAWAEQNQTINEVGSTYTIQGFDLNYAGVIIGPSVKYRNGKILFDPSLSGNKNAIRKRTLSSGIKMQVSDELLKNELNVLLTRGVKGLFLYAVDPELQKVLKKAVLKK
ncbi:DUF2075 domain-containing protein [uncultured Secundilactobacillus sp.]|uniref:DUF2075 domain-containing protein n=1 Tax=uncultured Secundilactobacillus sp. TaxID=2813935 RepID=UPI00258BE210|nr:DUF2075 domain-containing protein [uncultured Secundilactobacillus sp.]